MGFVLSKQAMETFIAECSSEYILWAPKRFSGGGTFSDTDCIRYGEIHSVSEVVFEEKSQFSFKEVLLPVSQILFYFTEDVVKEAESPKKGSIIFLRSCDLHALKRLDELYLHNGPADYYYARLRDRIKIVLMGCEHSFDNCFCVSMGTNQAENYNLSMDIQGNSYYLDCKDSQWEEMLRGLAEKELEVIPAHISKNAVNVKIPENLSESVAASSIWDEYDNRCINCGRCNFVCPTCTCFTMQDLSYSENGKVGERRRIWASCMVDGFTDVAGGGNYRQKNGQRMRFKVLHKVFDYKQRNGYHMCVGCGRCDDICPEYISFSGCVNKLKDGMKEVSKQ